MTVTGLRSFTFGELFFEKIINHLENENWKNTYLIECKGHFASDIQLDFGLRVRYHICKSRLVAPGMYQRTVVGP